MRHARDDYNRIQDPALHDPSLLAPGTEPFAEDEPVFLLRARDVFAPGIVRIWAAQAAEYGRYRIAEVAFDWAAEMQQWQEQHGCKLPNLPHPGGDHDD